MEAQALTDVCWALARFGFTPSDTWLDLLEEELLDRSTTQGSIGGIHDVSSSGDYESSSSGAAAGAGYGAGSGRVLSRQQLAVLLWAFERFRRVPRAAELVDSSEGLLLGAAAGH